MMYYTNFFPYHMFGFGPLFMVVFWVFIIWGCVSLVKYFSESTSSNGSDRALEILKERYVKGEITKEQFEAMKKDIR